GKENQVVEMQGNKGIKRLHRNDNWQPSTLILRRDGGNLDGGLGQSATPEELQKAKRREYNKQYRQRKKEELAFARQIQNGAKIPIVIDADKLLQAHSTKLAKHRECVKRYRLRNSSMNGVEQTNTLLSRSVAPSGNINPSLGTGDHNHVIDGVYDSGIWDPDASGGRRFGILYNSLGVK
ncbi:hypothetical protein EJB05_30301, partial [Eragrostis curvula]